VELNAKQAREESSFHVALQQQAAALVSLCRLNICSAPSVIATEIMQQPIGATFILSETTFGAG